MCNIENIQPVLTEIAELKNSTLLPRNWVKIIAQKLGKSETIIREWSKGIKNVPDGPMLVLEQMNQIINEKREKAKKLTA